MKIFISVRMNNTLFSFNLSLISVRQAVLVSLMSCDLLIVAWLLWAPENLHSF